MPKSRRTTEARYISFLSTAKGTARVIWASGSPDTIADITGRIDGGEGKLTFRDTALAFPLLAEDQLSPVSGPWIFYQTLRSGYLTAAGMEDDLLRLTIDDSYADDALTLDIWLDKQDNPIRAEILYDGCRILTLDIENFQIV